MSSPLARLIHRHAAAGKRAISAFASNGMCAAYNQAMRWVACYDAAIRKHCEVQPSLPGVHLKPSQARAFFDNMASPSNSLTGRGGK